MKRGGNVCASSLISQLRRSSKRVGRLALARCSVLTERENRASSRKKRGKWERETPRRESLLIKHSPLTNFANVRNNLNFKELICELQGNKTPE